MRHLLLYGLNLGLLFLALAGHHSRITAILGLALVALLVACWAGTAYLDRRRFHALIGANWIEGELSIYSTFALWSGLLIVGSAPGTAEKMPLFGIVTVLTVSGAIGLMASVLPLTRLSRPRP